jgi:predicted alpha/beta-fold hydrolase
VNVKGTDITNKKDILSDIKLGLGLSKHDKQFSSRRKQIKDHMKNEDPNSVTLVGHSLGGSIVTSAMAKSKSIRENVKSAEVFNTGYTKEFGKELSKGNLRNFNKKRKELLVDIITSNDLDISSLKPVTKKEVEVPKFTMRFGKFSPFAQDLKK